MDIVYIDAAEILHRYSRDQLSLPVNRELIGIEVDALAYRQARTEKGQLAAITVYLDNGTHYPAASLKEKEITFRDDNRSYGLLPFGTDIIDRLVDTDGRREHPPFVPAHHASLECRI